MVWGRMDEEGEYFGSSKEIKGSDLVVGLKRAEVEGKGAVFLKY